MSTVDESVMLVVEGTMMTKPATQKPPLQLRSYIADVPDFPKPGILFRDISPLLRSHFAETLEEMASLLSPSEWSSIDLIGGIESRGFILAAGLAATQKKGFVKIRKPGKLPGPIVKKQYKLEYGEDALEMHHGSGRMLIVDDVLATGGTLSAAADLAKQAGYEVQALVCLINLTFLNQFSWRGLETRAVVDYVD